MLDERTEQQISRRLDGELPSGESHEFDKELIRSPEVRRAFEDAQRIDALAAQTLHALLDDRKLEKHNEVRAGAAPPPPRRFTRFFLDGAISVAAAVLLIVVSTPLLPTGGSGPLPAGGPRNPPPGLQIAPSILPAPASVVSSATADQPALIPVIAGPRREHERIDQSVIGVVDPETQSVYLLEIQSARNTASPVRADY